MANRPMTMPRSVDDDSHDAVDGDPRARSTAGSAAAGGAGEAVRQALIDTELAHWRVVVEQRLRDLLPPPQTSSDAVAAAMRTAVLTPGKRIRPLLLLMAARCLGREPQRLVDAGCALEFVHAASLVLDDLPCMDDALLRRGQPALHRAFGEDVALLAAVALLSRAYGVLAAAASLDATARAEMVAALAEAVGPSGLVRGQWRDLREGAGGPDGPKSDAVRAAEETNQLKTGSLFQAAFELAAADAHAPDAARSALHSCAQHIGQAFQLQDDLDDSGDGSGSASASVTVQPDTRPTLVALLGREVACARLAEEIGAAQQVLRQAFGARSDGLCQLIGRITQSAAGTASSSH